MKKAPNIIIIMTDDQGYGDLSCMGASDLTTPHLDHLAQQGARFNCMYSNSPVCSPSRAALLTGRYPGYAGVRSVLAGHRGFGAPNYIRWSYAVSMQDIDRGLDRLETFIKNGQEC